MGHPISSQINQTKMISNMLPNDPNRPDYYYLNDVSLKTLSRGYLKEGIPVEDLKEAAIERANQLVDTAEMILNRDLPWLRIGVRRGWLSPASPIWSNFGLQRGLPISCNGSYMDDTMDSILFKNAEIGKMTQLGAGTSLFMGALREFGSSITGGGTSEGPVHFARLIQEQVSVISQSNVRRGNCAVWLPVEHPDIERWLEMRSRKDGVLHPIQHLSFGVTIGDEWMKEMLAEPKGGVKRKIMAAIRTRRRETGFPYILFKDNANNGAPKWFKDLGLEIVASNLCTEIMLPSGPKLSFVCDLSSINLLHWDEYKDTPFIKEAVYFLDAVMSEYIYKTGNIKFLKDARHFSQMYRALGLGVLGWHSLLQSKHLPVDSDETRALNVEIFKHLKEESYTASRELAEWYGEPEGMKGTGMRNLTLNALAPTKSSSIILGQISQSIEPWDANIFENDNAKGVFTQRNVFLEALLDSYGKNNNTTWKSILQAGGSVQHLDFLSEEDKNVYKTFVEIDQKELLRQNAERTPFIDQGTSHNVKLPPEATMKEDVDLIVYAWENGVKSLYYRKGLNKAQEKARADADCVACEA